MLPSACGLGQHFQDLGHSFSLYGPPSRQITYIYYHFLSRIWLYHPFFSQICFAEGRKHDSGMLADSGLLPLLERHGHSPAGQPMCVYGDPAYPLRVHLQAPFRNAVLTPQMEAYNTCMSKVRTSVEWLFGEIANSFKFLDFKKELEN